jgi:hypothetical protein
LVEEKVQARLAAEKAALKEAQGIAFETISEFSQQHSSE